MEQKARTELAVRKCQACSREATRRTGLVQCKLEKTVREGQERHAERACYDRNNRTQTVIEKAYAGL